MNDKAKNSLGPCQLAAGVLFVFLAVRSVWTMYQRMMVLGISGIWSLVFLFQFIGYVAVAIAAFTDRRDGIISIGFLMVFLSCLFRGSFHIFALLNLACWLVLLFFAVVQWLDGLAQFREICKKLWFLPLVVIGVAALPDLASAFRLIMWRGFGPFISFFLITVIQIAAIAAVSPWLVGAAVSAPIKQAQTSAGISPNTYSNTYPNAYSNVSPSAYSNGYSNGYSNANPIGNPYGNQPYVLPAEAYRSMGSHVLLLFFTLGIWWMIWVYRVTGYLNVVEDEKHRSPVAQLLLFLFVPFYFIYWTYQSAKRIDKLAAAKGMETDCTVISILLCLFLGIGAPIYMQAKMNNMITGTSAAVPAPSAPSVSRGSAVMDPAGGRRNKKI